MNTLHPGANDWAPKTGVKGESYVVSPFLAAGVMEGAPIVSPIMSDTKTEESKCDWYYAKLKE